MRSDRAYLLHICDSVQRIFVYTENGRKAFMDDIKTQDAVIRNFEIIGEAVKNISEGLKLSHPEIPWVYYATG